MNKTVYIYKGPGVGLIYSRILYNEIRKISSYPVSWIDEKQLNNIPWEDSAIALVFPGGRDVYYHKSLQGFVNKRIHSYVKNGGSYIGICAGAYYGASSLEFDVGHPLEVLGDRELNFFPGIARGPAYGYGSFCYNNESGGKVSKLRMNDNQILSSYYNGGCFFVDAHKHPDIEVIARYDDISEKPAAIIKCNVGKGKAILSGVHPEISATNLKTTDAFFEENRLTLALVEIQRQVLIKIIFDLNSPN